MHILLTNDDGIHAPGLRQLCEAAVAAGHTVTVAAPDRERSATSHAISLHRPLRANPVSWPGVRAAYAIDGTPVDSARLGLYLTMEAGCPADMAISGINRGPNLGSACVYSGTVNAALEAAMGGFPALASSLCSYDTDDYRAAARLTLLVAEWMRDHPLPGGIAYNLNVPALPYERIAGVRPARLAPQFLNPPRYERRHAPKGGDYFWVDDIITEAFDDPDMDEMLIRRDFATLTPIGWNNAAPNPYDVSIFL